MTRKRVMADDWKMYKTVVYELKGLVIEVASLLILLITIGKVLWAEFHH
jgi:hypothetical protein